MTQAIPTLTFAQAAARIDGFLARARRSIVGITGPPGVGKSTLAQRLQALHPQAVQLVPMDGFHLANAELVRLGRAQRKGAPDTFDSHGFAALLRRLRAQPQDGAGHIVYAPDFRREIEEPVAAAIPVFAHTRLLLAEGNYLAFERNGWEQVAPLLDEIWYVELAAAVRLERLIARHMQFGRTRQAAQQWVLATDEPNARLIEASLPRVHFRLRA